MRKLVHPRYMPAALVQQGGWKIPFKTRLCILGTVFPSRIEYQVNVGHFSNLDMKGQLGTTSSLAVTHFCGSMGRSASHSCPKKAD